MQNDLKKIENGKRPQKCLKWKTTSKNLKMEDDFKNFEKEKLKWKNEKGKRPEKSSKCKMT